LAPGLHCACCSYRYCRRRAHDAFLVDVVGRGSCHRRVSVGHHRLSIGSVRIAAHRPTAVPRSGAFQVSACRVRTVTVLPETPITVPPSKNSTRPQAGGGRPLPACSVPGQLSLLDRGQSPEGRLMAAVLEASTGRPALGSRPSRQLRRSRATMGGAFHGINKVAERRTARFCFVSMEAST